jgi:hypothetical protein
MARLAVKLLCFVVYFSVFTNTRASLFISPYAIKAVIDVYFSKNVHEIEIINFGAKIGFAQDRIEDVLNLENNSMAMKITRNTRKQPNSGGDYILNTSSILMFDSLDNYNQIKNKIVFQHGHASSHPHLVYVPNAKAIDLQIYHRNCFSVDKVIFLYSESRDSIYLARIYTLPENCSIHKIQSINSFERKDMKWKSSDFVVEKYTNFNNASITFGNQSTSRAFSWAYRLIAEALNFSIVSLREEGVYVDSFSFYFGFFSNEFLKTANMSTYMVEIEQRKIYIPPGELYGDYEKMFLPFDTSAWVAIVLLILFTVFAIVAIKLKPPAIQQIVFGSNNRSPLMNFISILINGSQNTRLIENAPRICLAVFLFWSLIIR